MTLPAPAPSSSSSLEPLPPQWQGSEESVRAWLQTKAEEERRKAEEERTRQEQYRGDTRRVELEMLRESFKYGIPPPLVPLVLMGKGASGEWAHELVAQHMGMAQHVGQLAIQASAHPASPAGPALRRETRSIQQMHQQPVSSQGTGQPAPPPPPPHPHQQQQLMGPPGSAGGGVPLPPHYSTYQLTSAARPGSSQSQPQIQTITPQGAPPRSNLPRINTGPGEPKYIQQHPLPMGPPPGAPGPPAHQTSHHQQETVASQISFHHWVPPTTQSGGGGTSSSAQANAASPQRQLDSPFTHHPAPNVLSGSDYMNVSSPKKRKMTTQLQHPPPPSTQPFSPQAQSVSSPASATPRTRRGHTRNRSDTNPPPPPRGYDPYSRPTTRQRRSVGAGEASSIGEAISHVGQQSSSSSYQPSANDSGGSAGHSGSGTPSHTTPQESQQQQQQEHQGQQSVPPPQPSQAPSRPYSAGSDYRTQPYQLPLPPPPDAGSERDREREQGDGGRS